MQEKVLGLLLAGGQGSRMEASVNKVLLPVAGIPCIARSAKALSGFTDHLILVYHAGEEAGLKSALDCFPPDCSWSLVQGGETRQESVFHGIRKAAEAYPGETVILIHDGARVMITPDEICRVLNVAFETGAATLGTPVIDTIKVAGENGDILSTPDRSTLWAVQTPQVFVRDLYLRAIDYAVEHNLSVTDDCSLVEALGVPVRIVRGEYTNIKLTTPSDVVIAEALLKRK